MDLLYVQSADLIQFSDLILEEVDVNSLIFQQSAHCVKNRAPPKSIYERLIVCMTFETPPGKEAAEQQSLNDTDES